MKTKITPQAAKELLESAPENVRRINRDRLARYVRDIKNGKWEYNGESIKVDSEGRLRDGQHRLLAVVEAGIPIITEFVDGIDNVSFIDTGQPRTPAVLLSMQGEKYSVGLAAAASFLFKYEHRKVMHNVFRPSTNDILHVIEKRPKLRDFVYPRNRSLKAFRRGGFFAFRYCAHQVDEEMASQFFSSVESGVNLDEGDPPLTLRDYLLSQDSRARHFQRNDLYQLALAIKAFNYFLEGKKVTRLRWITVGNGKEDFPRIEFYDELAAQNPL